MNEKSLRDLIEETMSHACLNYDNHEKQPEDWQTTLNNCVYTILKLVEEETPKTSHALGIYISNLESQLAELKQIVIEDVPHKYQSRLLEKLK